MEPEGSLPHSQVSSICSYPNPTRCSPCPHFLKIHINTILPSTSGSPTWSLCLKFSHQNTVYAFPLPYTCYMSRPSHSRFHHPNNIGWGVQNAEYVVSRRPVASVFTLMIPSIISSAYGVNLDGRVLDNIMYVIGKMICFYNYYSLFYRPSFK
jgi:hypothetical protein